MANKDLKFIILLSTYNGQFYLDSFLNSLLNQTYKNFSLIIRDDGSDDQTLEILRRWQNKNQISLTIIIGENIGWRNSFNRLLAEVNADYILFADQDDIWLQNKLDEIRKFIIINCKDCNNIFLISHNANIIDSDDNILARDVLLGYKNFDLIVNKFNELSGGLYGCTICISRGLKEKVNILDKFKYISHDHKCLIVACYFGNIYNISIPLISWRKHRNSSNVSGFSIYFKKIYVIIKLSIVESNISGTPILLLIIKKIKFILQNYFMTR